MSSEYGRLVAAANTFRDKYMAYPGDFRDATRFWGRLESSTHCATNSGAAVVASGVCDGNGDGSIQAATGASRPSERMQFWRHLALAGLIEGTYTGVASTGGVEHSVPGSNVPVSRVNNGAWYVETLVYAPNPGSTSTFAMDYGNSFGLGAIVSNRHPYGKLLKPEEAWNLDTKVDDGLPARGKVIAQYWDTECSRPNNGAAASDNHDASYNLSDNTIQCSLKIRNSM